VDPNPEAEDWWEEPPPRPRRGLVAVRVIAATVIVAMLLAFPFGPLLDQLIQNRAYEAVVAIVEFVVIGCAWLWLRSLRRVPR
jgi:predicted MFS family arabinose efflux permease